MLGYGVKTAKMPVRVQATNNGCLWSRMVRPGMYDAACSQKTPRKNSRNESNISIKKYHHKPTLGVRSGSKRRTPYVAARKSHDPVKKADTASNVPVTAVKPSVCMIVNDQALGVVFVFAARASYKRTRSGGKRSSGCMPRYAANDRASVKVMLAPWEALAMAVRMNMFVRAEVERARHVKTVNGLKRNLQRISIKPLHLLGSSYPAAMALLLHRRSFLDEVNSRETAAEPLCAT